MKKWEYKIVVHSEFDTNSVEDFLNVFGTQGWEVFRVEKHDFSYEDQDSSSGYTYTSKQTEYTFWLKKEVLHCP